MHNLTRVAITVILSGFAVLSADAQPARCVRVTIQLEQEAVVGRSAFRASLTLKNESAGPVTSILAAPDIRDPQGAAANARFGIAAPELSGMTAVDGTGTLAPGAEGRATWLIVPRDDAAPTEPLVYGFGGTLQYVSNGNTLTIPLEAVRLTVLPNPRLQPKYFWEKYVYSDDPFTSTVEPSRPFTVALMMSNVGAGAARNMRITTAQPRIVRNDDELVIAFQLLDTRVDNQVQTPSLTVGLGDILPGQSRIARYRMSSTLQGKFISYTASYQHLTDLGGVVSSLIDEGYPKVFELIQPVRSQEPGADDLPDFLTDEKSGADDPNESDSLPQFFDLPDTLHLSDNTVSPVRNVIDATVQGTGPASATIAANVPGDGWRYIVVDDPFGGVRPVTQIRRSDGRVLVSENVWQTDRIFQPAGNNVVYRARLHLLDKGGSGQYELSFGEPTNLPPLPVITQQPQAVAVCPGGPATLRVAASGTGPLTYQWRRDGLPVPGATQSEYAVAEVIPSVVGSYDCVVSNARGGVASQAASLSLKPLPSITTQPINRVVCRGGVTTFSLVAAGPGPLTYRWQRNGVNLAGATAATLVIANASDADVASYACVVTGECGSTTSAAVTLQVVDSPTITQHPQPRVACLGSPASFTVAATGAAPFSFQWRRDGTPVPGATQQTLAIPAVGSADAGTYDCIVTNACGNATSTSATLVVPGRVTSQPADASACVGGSISLSVSAVEATGIQWLKNGTPLADGPQPDGTIVSGATTDSLQLANVSLAAAGRYAARISTSQCSPTLSDEASVVISDPTIRANWDGPFTFISGEQPVATTGAAMAFDSRRGVAVLFGGLSPQGYSAHTWVWNGDTWAQAPATGPSARAGAAMAFDAARGRVVLVGGENAAGMLGDAWSWDGSVWTSVPTPPSMAARRHAAMTFDAARGRLVLFGGHGRLASGAMGPLNDTWEFDGVAWTNVSSASSPPAREGATFAFDAARQVSLLFGGSGAATFGDTWEWNGTTWTQRSLAGPSARAFHSMVFDDVRQVVRLYGGGAASVRDDVWEFDGATWTMLSTTGTSPGGRQRHAAAYDARRGRDVVWGGSDATAQGIGQTWTHTASNFALAEHPSAAAACQGRGVTLRAVPATPGAYTFRWYRSGTLLTDSEFITGAGTDTLNVTFIPSAIVGSYRCVVADACGEISSDAAAVEADGTDNMLNGSFESGGDGWQLPSAESVACNAGAARTGACFISLDDQTGSGEVTQVLWRPIQRWEVAQLSVWARRLRPGEPAFITLVAANASAGVDDAVSFELSDRWELFSVDMESSGVQEAIESVRIEAASGGTRYAAAIDDVVLRVRCPADFNCDGGIDGVDIEVFVDAWSGGDLSADANQDGGVDAADIDVFFEAWSSGGC